MTRILFFEAVSGGGLVSEPVPTGSLLAEGLAMRSAIIQDLEDAATSAEENVVSQRLRQWLPDRSPGIQWLLPIDHRLESIDQAISLNPLRENEPSRPGDSKPIDLQINTGKDLWDSRPRVESCQASRDSWSVPQTPSPLNAAKYQWFPIRNADECDSTLATCAASADLILIIAPEPQLAHYLKRLSDWQSRLINVSPQAARLAGDKRNYNSNAMLWHPGDEADASSRPLPKFLQNATEWVVKPYDQCGAQGVWKLALAPSVDPSVDSWKILESWYRALQSEDKAQGPLMISPWYAGASVSVSFLTTPQSCTRFPACEQQLQLVQGPNQQPFKSWKVQYVGSRWARPPIQNIVNQRLLPRLKSICQQHGITAEQFRGWFGVDLLVTEHDLEWVDFNARWTSSYNLIRHLRTSR